LLKRLLYGNKRKKSLAALFSFIPIEAITKQWSREVPQSGTAWVAVAKRL
jgi:hypothetical protein